MTSTISKVPRYNAHASGVETIEIIRHLPFNHG